MDPKAFRAIELAHSIAMQTHGDDIVALVGGRWRIVTAHSLNPPRGKAQA